ncbi:hypothetical protein OGAPHI_005971 [Ogataea philodendri]|uniref:Pyridoxamine kinase/Phosphomethylpyrimidine kinase domain-containing protein n=1 Tax=Ogataea philodendri TaxID=1378263 RepID=A0A9P8NWY0_9ASCO|nr:uncharacterized protein OGAPHI_005971 [Ogataea philodendri]KAH3661793.1 hypothetical protein OGAPHI_005971 [Ogataea philodendri]
MVLVQDLLHPSAASEAKKHKLKTLVQEPRSFFMDVKCPGCLQITTVFSHAQTAVTCDSCTTVLCTPTGVAGSDPSGGAGIEADLKTISAHGCYGLTSIDMLTIQNTLGVTGKLETSYSTMEQLLSANFANDTICAVKIGVLSRSALSTLVPYLERYRPILVVDTVISSTSGFNLAKRKLVEDSIAQLYPKATILTPNYDEATTIYNLLVPDVQVGEPSVTGCEFLAKNIALRVGCEAVLVKGGHVPAVADKIVDVLYERGTNRYTHFAHPKIYNSKNTHGTGCTLSSAIASNLAKKQPVQQAVRNSIIYVHNAIRHAEPSIGKGNGPLNHVYMGIVGGLPGREMDSFATKCLFQESDGWNRSSFPDQKWIHSPFFSNVLQKDLVSSTVDVCKPRNSSVNTRMSIRFVRKDLDGGRNDSTQTVIQTWNIVIQPVGIAQKHPVDITKQFTILSDNVLESVRARLLLSFNHENHI